MKIKVLTFGKINETIPNHELEIEDEMTTDNLVALLESSYPSLKNNTYKLAINNAIIHQNMSLKPNDEIALLPPFSGG